MDRSRLLAARLRTSATSLISLVETIDEAAWSRSPGPRVWSIGKEAEHVADAAVYHQWIVRLTIGERVASRRPPIERAAMTTRLSPGGAAALILQRSDDAERLLQALTDDQLDLPTRPPRAKGERLAMTIERVLIGHYDVHQTSIEAKLQSPGGSGS